MVTKQIRFWLVFTLFATLLALITSQLRTAASEVAETYTGTAQIAGPLQLDLTLSPPVSSPGDTLYLNVRLVNYTQVTSNPEIIITLPPTLVLDSYQMPSGINFNLQTNSVNWSPFVSASGGIQEFALPLRVGTADLEHPEQIVTAVLQPNSQNAEETPLTTSLKLWIGMAPFINNVLSQTQVGVGQPIQLKADIAGPGPMTQIWDLGDGRRITVNDPIVVYPAAGLYDVTLEVSNPLTAVSRKATITVVPHPAAQFTPDDDTPSIGQLVTFINQSGGQPPISYFWEFGDGVTDTNSTASHSYSSPGSYQVHLTIQNAFGKSEAFWQINVGQGPTADMAIDASVQMGSLLRGQAFGDSSVTQYRWNMGDGHTVEGADLSYTYAQSGDFYVTMTASNTYGSTEVGRWVHVDPGIVTIYLPWLHKSLQFASEPNGSVDEANNLVLEPVELNEPYVITPVDLPANTHPADALLFYINQVRNEFGLQPLTQVYELNMAAQEHATDMATVAYTAHAGSDGSYPAERLFFYGYSHAYAGEATSWGFQNAYEAVEFWVNSPAHRRIILNRYATDVGVGYTFNISAPNVWYWTAEFGNAFQAPATPAIRLQSPLTDIQVLITNGLTYSWNWPVPLTETQQFVVYLYDEKGTAVWLGSTNQPNEGIRYAIQKAAIEAIQLPGTYQWQVQLQDGDKLITASEPRTLLVVDDPNLIVPTATPTATPTPLPTAVPTDTPTPTPEWPTATPLPPVPTPPIIETAAP